VSRPGLSELATQVLFIKEARRLTYAQIAAECRNGDQISSVTISGLCCSHAVNPDFEKQIRQWVERNNHGND
jgi:hypothetical protein